MDGPLACIKAGTQLARMRRWQRQQHRLLPALLFLARPIRYRHEQKPSELCTASFRRYELSSAPWQKQRNCGVPRICWRAYLLHVSFLFHEVKPVGTALARPHGPAFIYLGHRSECDSLHALLLMHCC